MKALNYVFWGTRRGYFERVQAMLEEPSFPNDPAGGLDARFPQSLGAPTISTLKPGAK